MLNKKRSAGICRAKLWLKIACGMLLTAFTICLSCAVLFIGQMKNQEWAMDGIRQKSEKIRIYIDQGHNPVPYHNGGAEGNGLYEQDLTYKIGCLLAERLKKDGRFEVCLSRPDENTVLGTDNTSSLKARVDGAADFHADYFISLHINSFSQNTAKGIEVFSATEGTESYAFGNSLLQGMVDSTGLRNRGMKLNPNLYVLKNTTMPAVLLEMGFISNSEEAALLSEHPELFVQGIYDGILNYFDYSMPASHIHILPAMIGLALGMSIVFIAVGFIITVKCKSVVQEKQSEVTIELNERR